MGIPLWESPPSKALDKSSNARCNTLPPSTWDIVDPDEWSASASSSTATSSAAASSISAPSSEPPEPTATSRLPPAIVTAAVVTRGADGTASQAPRRTLGANWRVETAAAIQQAISFITEREAGPVHLRRSSALGSILAANREVASREAGNSTVTTATPSSGSSNSMLTLEEFLRETSRTTADPEIQSLMLMRHRTERDRVLTHTENTSSRTLFDQTPAGQLHLGIATGYAQSMADVSVSPHSSGEQPRTRWREATTVTTPATADNESNGTISSTITATTNAAVDTFETLVNQIRRIGALQDVILSSVSNVVSTIEDAPARTAGNDHHTHANANRRERNRSAVENLRMREARLRAMQSRIDSLANEFAILRTTRRELQRVEAEAMEIQRDARRASLAMLGAGAQDETDENMIDRSIERRALRRAFLRLESNRFARENGTNTISSTDPGATSVTPAIAGGLQDDVSAYRRAFQRLESHYGGENSAATTHTAIASTASSTVSTTPAVSEGGQDGPVLPVSIDRRSPSMTADERDLLLRNAIMQMQIERMANAP